MSSTTPAVVRRPGRGKAHLVTGWHHSDQGRPWASARPTKTACGFGDGSTLRSMEEVDLADLDASTVCRRCWPTLPKGIS